MADNIANILMRIGGEDDGASDTLQAFLAKLKAFGKTEATAEADVSTRAGASKLSVLEAALAKFGRETATAKAEVDVESSGLDNLTESLKRSALQAQVTEKQLNQLSKKKVVTEAEVRVQEADLKKVQQDLDRRNKLVLPVGVQFTKARRDMARALAEISAAVEGTTPEVQVSVEGALQELSEVQAAVKAFNAASQDIRVEGYVDVTTAPAATKLALLSAQLRKFAASRAIAEAEIKPVVPNLTRTFAELRAKAAAANIEVRARIDTMGMVSELDRALAAMNGMVQARGLEVKPQVNTASGFAELARWVAAVKAADNQKINVKYEGRGVALATMALAKLGSVFASAAQGATRLGGSLGAVTVNFGMFGLKLTPLVGIVLALAVAMGISLVAALSLLVTALAGATLAVGALAIAFVGALGPMVAVAVATVGRITKIVQALKAKTEADKAAAKGSAESVAAEERRRDALVAVGRAMRGVETAERGVEQARESASDAIVAANRDMSASQRAAGQAAAEVGRQTVAAYKAVRDAAEDARDAILDVEAAQIGIDRASIATQRAELALAAFRKEAGLTAAEFDSLFERFTDVAVDFDPASLQGIVPAGTGAGAAGEDPAIRAAELVLDLREAKLGEKQATDTLQDSEQALSEKRQLANKYAREGIAAYEPLTAAIYAQESATIQLGEATERANELTKAGIDNAPGVIAANEALVNSQEALKEARHNAEKAATGAAGGEAAKKAKADWDALTKAEQLFALALKNTGTALRSAFQPAVEGALAGIGQAMLTLPGILAPLEGSFKRLGEAMGGVIADFATFAATPAMSSSFQTLIDGATELVTILGGRAWQAFFEIMTNLATAAMPLLIATSKLFANWLERIAKRTRDPEKMGHAMSSLGDIFFAVLGLVKQLGRIFLNFFKATGPQAVGFVGTLTEMAKGLADFLGSTEGQEKLQKFFKAVIPLAIQTIKFIGNAILFVMQVIETLAPALTGLLQAFNLILGITNRILGVFKPFLKIAAQIALLFIGGLPFAIGKFLSKFRLLAPLASFLMKHTVGIIVKIIGRIAAFASAFPEAFEKVKTFILGFVSWLGTAFKDVLDILTWPFKQAIKFITDLGGKFFEAGAGIIKAIIEGMKSLIGGIGGIAGKVFKFLVDKLPGSEPRDKTSPLAGLPDRGRAIVENLAAGITANSDILARSLHGALVPVVAGIDANVNVPRAKAAPSTIDQGAGQRGGFHADKVEVMLDTAGNGTADPRSAARRVARELETYGGGIPR